jgi:hypothetical protein
METMIFCARVGKLAVPRLSLRRAIYAVLIDRALAVRMNVVVQMVSLTRKMIR